MDRTAQTQLKPLMIGNVQIGFPVVQAALSGYSDWAMRVIARRLGASYTLCEVMLDQFLLQVRQRKRTRHFLHVSDEEHPVGGQLMGADPEQFAAGARRLVEAGFDIIDINFGCPVKKVVGKCRGGFHLGQPDVALEIVQQTRDAVPDAIPVAADGILVVEGNYLLLDEPGWRELRVFADLGVFVECPEETLRTDVLIRHRRGGRSEDDAVRHYEFNDRPNWRRVMEHRQGVDLLLRVMPGRGSSRCIQVVP